MKVPVLMLVQRQMREDWTCSWGRFYPRWRMRPPLRHVPFAGSDLSNGERTTSRNYLLHPSWLVDSVEALSGPFPGRVT